MSESAKTGVFLCKCGEKIDPLVDLEALKKKVINSPDIAYCEIMPYPCLKSCHTSMKKAVETNHLNRIIVAGCEGRLMLSKLEREWESMGLRKGQIGMINLRGHVASVSDLTPVLKAEKGAKLIKALAAELAVFTPVFHRIADIEGPVMIVGGGIASYSAALELARHDIECILSNFTDDTNLLIRDIHNSYPGEYHYYTHIKDMAAQIVAHPKIKTPVHGKLMGFTGVTGNYTVTFADKDGKSPHKYKASIIITCLDGELTFSEKEFNYDGETVLIQNELEEMLFKSGVPKGDIVFWINDYEAGYPEFAHLSIRSAWSIAKFILQCSRSSRVSILYNQDIQIPLSAPERVESRKLGVQWIPYDRVVPPTIQAGNITFFNLLDHIETEVAWNYLALSPKRVIGTKAEKIAAIMDPAYKEGHFLTDHRLRVKKEMISVKETYTAGSARYPCDLHDALTQGRRAGKKTAEIMLKSRSGELLVPRIVSEIDVTKCIGCGQCQELCECNSISLSEEGGEGVPRVVDSLRCTGGGACGASCPYNAITLLNNTIEQKEARAAALSRQLASDEVLAFACSWGGMPASHNAGKKGLHYDHRIYLLGVACLGELDLPILVLTFLEGAPGTLLIGCDPEDCHHSNGIDHAWSRVNMIKKLLAMCGIDRRRIALAHADLNKPEDFVRTVESFTKTLSSLGHLEMTPMIQNKLQSMYDMVKYNDSVRLLLSSHIRRPMDEMYHGEPIHALSYDREFTNTLTEEFLQARLIHQLKIENHPMGLYELSEALEEDEGPVSKRLWDMVYEGLIDCSYSESEPKYMPVN